ncbi:response regulator transcription factor [Tumebacillus sp. DT12]|uniref:Response regulator transcription factor n=1 Tax=Tumebacillus lacus TaxID=2995335 RepID=A0ABT3WYU3_9BACL|nr:response regulator transcription factor [Tumebacillus lacus]MCX7569849.1 response regulator transcription factor [Tumebacillus lacus]
MSRERILIADDEADMRTLLRIALQAQGYETLEAENGRVACAMLERDAVDLLILDIMMPEMDGYRVLRELRGEERMPPTLILSARGSVDDRVQGLELGASDYLVKPFDMRELVARVAALLRRHSPPREDEFLIDRLAKEVRIAGARLDLTPKEFELLELLANRPQQVFTREQIVELLWGYDYTGELRAVDTHIKNIRLKLREAGADPGRVATVRGFGYKYEAGQA